MDCLVCHDTTGTYQKFPTGAGYPVLGEAKEFPPGSGKIWEPVDLVAIAQTVGLPDRDNCGSCHFYGGGGDGVKHGDMDDSLAVPDRELDVHMDAVGEDFSCATCHGSDGLGQGETAVAASLDMPNLIAPDWEKAGDLAAIRRSIYVGHESQMPSWGLVGLKYRDIDAVSHYIDDLLRATE